MLIDLFLKILEMLPTEIGFYEASVTYLVGKSKGTSAKPRTEQTKQNIYSGKIVALSKLKSNHH
jgi:hypothetical protein